jgi:hypothetical protein
MRPIGRGRKFGLQINEGRIEYVVVWDKALYENVSYSSRVGHREWNRVKEFKYLGLVSIEKNETKIGVAVWIL